MKKIVALNLFLIAFLITCSSAFAESKILELSETAAKTYGFSKGILAATLSGLVFYKAKGWIPVSEDQTTLINGVVISVILMEKHFS